MPRSGPVRRVCPGAQHVRMGLWAASHMAPSPSDRTSGCVVGMGHAKGVAVDAGCATGRPLWPKNKLVPYGGVTRDPTEMELELQLTAVGCD